jgi:hypothetical protein
MLKGSEDMYIFTDFLGCHVGKLEVLNKRNFSFVFAKKRTWLGNSHLIFVDSGSVHMHLSLRKCVPKSFRLTHHRTNQRRT